MVSLWYGATIELYLNYSGSVLIKLATLSDPHRFLWQKIPSIRMLKIMTNTSVPIRVFLSDNVHK